MGIFDKWLSRPTKATPVPSNSPAPQNRSVAVGASEQEAVTVTFNNKNFTYS